MILHFTRHVVFLLAAIILFSCSATKTIPEGSYLYTGHSLEAKFNKKTKNKSYYEGEISGELGPNTNRRILGMPIRLWIYNKYAHVTKEKGLKAYLKNKVGEKPVLFDPSFADQIVANLRSEAVKLGFFNPQIRYEYVKKPKKKKAEIKYYIQLDRQYKVDSIGFNLPNNALGDTLKKYSLKYLEGDYFSYYLLDKTLKQIEDYAQNRGFYNFDNRNILFQADTSGRDHNVSLRLGIKENSPVNISDNYSIKEVVIYTDRVKTNSPIDSVECEGRIYYQYDNRYNPNMVFDYAYLKPGDVYSRKKLNNSNSHYSQLGVFSLVDTRLTSVDSLNNELNLTHIMKSSLPKRFETKLTFSSKSNGFLGPILENSITNKNAFHGGERLIYSVQLGFEKQLYSNYSISHILSAGASVELQVPRLVTPFKIKYNQEDFVPYTNFKLNYQFYRYAPYFNSQSFGPSIMYSWLNARKILFELTVLDINYRNNKGDTNPIENSSFAVYTALEDRMIVGGNYYITIKTDKNLRRRAYWNWRVGFDLSGNVLNAFYQNGHSKINKEILGVPFSQYTKFESEESVRLVLNRKNALAMRFLSYVGIPYGNSVEIPYFKQYSIGGPYSLRAFLPRTIGPGTFETDNSGTNFVLHSGEIHLEANVEYRFDLSRILEGAVFLETGNIWLMNDDEARPGGVFKGSEFYKQLAVGTGAGIRVNIEYIVIRLDVGLALRRPTGWIGGKDNRIDDFSSFTRNIVWNFAIGYPF